MTCTKGTETCKYGYGIANVDSDNVVRVNEHCHMST